MQRRGDAAQAKAEEAHRRAEAFRAATRHSAHVRLAKRGIVALAALSVVGGLGATLFSPLRGAPSGLTLEAIGVSGSKVTMAAPKLNGFRNDSRPYQIAAREAVQDVSKPNLVELRDLDARVAMGAQGSGHITARIGHYDSLKETMELNREVRMRTDEGHELLMSRAFIDFKGGTMVSPEPVTAHLRASTVEANSLSVGDGGRVMVFEGRVRTQIKPEAPAAAAIGVGKGSRP